LPAARTEISDDGKAIVVHRFDVDDSGQLSRGMEDFCALLGLRPAAKYDTTWERIARAVRDHVPGERQVETCCRLAAILLLTYALRNADCHARNLALLYTKRADVQLAPAYEMITTTVYAGYQHNPPGISFMGRKTWLPGKSLVNFIAGTFGISLKAQKELIEAISDAVSDTAPKVRAAMRAHDGFKEIGMRVLLVWKEGVNGLREKRVYDLPAFAAGSAFKGLTTVPKLSTTRVVRGRSKGLAIRRKKKKIRGR
jgi:serine/threonine-protein kinase HipA